MALELIKDSLKDRYDLRVFNKTRFMSYVPTVYITPENQPILDKIFTQLFDMDQYFTKDHVIEATARLLHA